MGQLKDIDNDMRRRARILELTAKYMDQRIARLELDAAKALAFESVEEMREWMRTYVEEKGDIEEKSPIRNAHLGKLTLGRAIEKKVEAGEQLGTHAIGGIGENMAFNSLRNESKVDFTRSKRVTQYLMERGISLKDIELRSFPLKTVYKHGPDYFFADAKTGKAVGIVEIKATTNRPSVTSVLNSAAGKIKDFFNEKEIRFVRRRYRVDLRDVEYGLALAIWFDPKKLNDPDYEILYRTAIVKKPSVGGRQVPSEGDC